MTAETESKVARRERRIREPDILNDPEGSGNKRQYIKITPEIEGQILAAKHRLGAGASYANIAEMVGLPVRTVTYVLSEMPHLKRQKEGDQATATSLKERAYDLIREVMVIKDVHQLRELLGYADDEHAIVHVLHSLHTQGRIDFDERGNGQGTATYVNIRMPKRGPRTKRVLMDDGRAETIVLNDDGSPAGEPEPDPVAQVTDQTPSQPTPEAASYPLLDALVARETQRVKNDETGLAYVAAAQAIEKIDPDMARDLMAKAEALTIPFPAPIEREYLRYVQAHKEINVTLDNEDRSADL